MKKTTIDLNDPRITAFALGELEGVDAVAIARAVHSDQGVRQAVDEVRATAYLLSDSLGASDVLALTSEQHQTIRSAGGVSNITAMPPAGAKTWKRSLIAGMGVAAALTVTLFMIRGNQPSSNQGSLADHSDGSGSAMDWSKMDMVGLDAPAARSGVGANHQNGNSSAHVMAAAIADDTDKFRQELAKRIEQRPLAAASDLPSLKGSSWQKTSKGKVLNVPLSSGAASWPWVSRYLRDENTLPPRQAVRIEEMVNHFRYTPPTMLQGAQLVADMEICTSPWNTKHLLLAVHVSARQGVDPGAAVAELVVNEEKIQRVRLLGYADELAQATASSPLSYVSKSRGNYLIYELELTSQSALTEAPDGYPALATLRFGNKGDATKKSNQLKVNRISAWQSASSDLRFASTVAATGILLSQRDDLDGLDASSLARMVQQVESKSAGQRDSGRKEALMLIKRAGKLLES